MKELAVKLINGIYKKDISRKDRDFINELRALGVLKTSKNKIKLNSKYKIGTIDIAKNKTGFLQVLGEKVKDLLIEPKDLNGASKGDLVIAKRVFNKNSRPKAVVKYILQKEFEYSVAFLEHINNDTKVYNIKTMQPIILNVKKRALKKLPHHMVFKVNNYTNEIEEVLGILDNPFVDEKISLALYNKKEEFSKKAINEAKSFGDYVDKTLYNREDLTDLSFCTIDPIDAKDHDDAIYFDKQNKILYVAIADVSEYVYLNGYIDQEAQQRGFSIYFPHKSIPMLPRELSENICSLKENQDRLAFVFKIYLDEKNEVIKEELIEAIIKSKRKYSYEEVDAFLEGKPPRDEIDKEILSWLIDLYEITTHLKVKRLKKGYHFVSDEIRLKLDKNQEIEKVYINKETPSHALIEDCMLLANKAAAKRIDYGIFRTHEKPSEETLKELYSDLQSIGINIEKDKKLHKIIKNIQKQADAMGMREYIDKMIIRSQKQAQYTTENKGHFALGFDKYTHFTSPIRRYSDLTLHRLLKAQLHNNQKFKDYILRNIESLVVKISTLEREAMKVEWDFYDRKFARYADKHIGKVFNAIVIDEDRNPIVKIIDEELFSARVFLGKDNVKLFDKVKVKIIKANIATTKIKGEVVV